MIFNRKQKHTYNHAFGSLIAIAIFASILSFIVSVVSPLFSWQNSSEQYQPQVLQTWNVNNLRAIYLSNTTNEAQLDEDHFGEFADFRESFYDNSTVEIYDNNTVMFHNWGVLSGIHISYRQNCGDRCITINASQEFQESTGYGEYTYFVLIDFVTDEIHITEGYSGVHWGIRATNRRVDEWQNYLIGDISQ